MDLTSNHPFPTQTSPRLVMPDGPLFRYIRALQQITGIYRWSHLQVVLYLLGSQNKVARHTGCSKATVFKVFRILQENGLMVKLMNSVRQISQPLLDLAKRGRR